MALLTVAASACEGLVGIRDPVLVDDASTATALDASADVDASAADAGADAGPRELRFEATTLAACSSGGVLDVALARSEPGSPQDGALVALEQDSLWICRDPLGDLEVEEIPLDVSGAQAMVVGDLTNNGTDDIALLELEGRLFVFELQADGSHELDVAFTEFGSGADPAFLQRAELSGSDLPDLVMVKGIVTLLRQAEGQWLEEFQTEMPPPDAAIFASFETPGVPDIVTVSSFDGQAELSILRADDSEPHYELEDSQPIAVPIGDMQAVIGSDGLLSFLVVPTAERVAVLDRQGTGLSEPTYRDDLDLVGPMATGDLDGDGIDDLIGVRAGGSQGALWLSGASDSALDELDGFGLDDSVTALAIADVDGDGLADIIAAGPDGITIYRQLP